MTSPYVREPPSPQQTLDVFAGKWASRFPGELGALRAGSNLLFEDPKIQWAAEKLQELGVTLSGSTVLELGPLEGGHTYSLSKAGAASVTAIEAHQEAYLKCLISKELLGMERVNFLLGDAVAFLRQIGHSYDIGIASGILYHMADPVELIELLCLRCRAVYVWTVHWDQEFSRSNPAVPRHRLR
jgi:2-polyprenyl-3-methyl-5-hydroxy-6-metoxy-1,4-benzoquinol methylase